MSRPRLFVGTVVFAAAALLAAVVSLAAAVQDRKEAQPTPTRVEYTVASAARTTPPVGARVVVPERRGSFGPLPETLTLVVVGSMLIGLAAAVRRTT